MIQAVCLENKSKPNKENTLKKARKTSRDNKKDPKGNETKAINNERELTTIELKNLLKTQNIDRDKKSPCFFTFLLNIVLKVSGVSRRPSQWIMLFLNIL